MKTFPNAVKFDRSHRTKSFKGMKASKLSLYTTGFRLISRRPKLNPFLTAVQIENARLSVRRAIQPRSHKKKKKFFQKKNQVIQKKKKQRRYRKGLHKKHAFKLRYNYMHL